MLCLRKNVSTNIPQNNQIFKFSTHKIIKIIFEKCPANVGVKKCVMEVGHTICFSILYP